MNQLTLALLTGALFVPSTHAMDLDALWDFRRPELSEQRFRSALAQATGDEALILQTQIARSYGLRGEFAQARDILLAMEPKLASSGPEPKVRHALELGRTYASAKHSAEELDANSKAQARRHFARALSLAKQSALDGLAIDAIHMMAFVDTAPAEQLHWAQQALAVVEASPQAQARRWEGPIRNNLGYALHQLKRYPEALDQFERALALRERAGKPEEIRIARWMVAWTLRALGRRDEALALQLRLERENEAAGTPDPYVFGPSDISVGW